MAQDSKIEWTKHTGNLWWGCSKVHAGCDNCYAEALSKRVGGASIWGKDTPRKATKSIWNNFMKWNALAAADGEIHRVFVGSMMDIFEKPMPLINWNGGLITRFGNALYTDIPRDYFFNEIVPACPNLLFLLLTKRPGNINKYIPKEWKRVPPANVMFGTSPVDQKTFKTLVPQLKQVAGHRFLSIEPQLDVILPTYDDLDGIHWVIQGGESGPKRRPFDTRWGEIMRAACKRNGIPFFFKQIDKVLPIPNNLLIRQFPKF